MARRRIRRAAIGLAGLLLVLVAACDPVVGAGIAPVTLGGGESVEATNATEYVVVFEADHADDADAAIRAYAERTDGVDVRRSFDAVGGAVVAVDAADVGADDLRSRPGVTRAFPNERLRPPATDPEPVAEHAVDTASHGDAVWGVDRVGAPEFWAAAGTRGDGVRLVVLDTGVDPDHPDVDLADDGWAEFDATGERIDSDPYDVDGHGTQVSSVLTGGNASGSHLGVAPGAELHVGGVLTPEGETVASVLAGIDWAIENDADVLSISAGLRGYHDEFVEPIRRAERRGVLVVAAVGNGGEGTSHSPGNVYETLSVGATTSAGDVRSDSGGETIQTESTWLDPPSDWPSTYVVPDVTAPGQNVKAADAGGGYVRIDQTSTAAPHAAGVAALLLAERPTLTPSEVKRYLTESAVTPEGAPSEHDTRYGNGVVNAREALRLLEERPTLSGTVTDESGAPLRDVPVRIDGTQRTVTDENGTFAVQVAPGERSVAVSGFGLDANSTTVQIVDEDVHVELTAARQSVVEVASPPPERVAPGERYEVELRVAGVEQYEPSLAPGSLQNVSLAAHDLNASQEVSDLDRGEVLTVTIETPSDELGELALRHRFQTSSGETLQVQSRATTVLEDPLTVGQNGTVETLGEALSVAVDGTTIELADDRYDLSGSDDPLAVTDSVTITAAADVEPRLTGLGAADREGDVGLQIAADDVALSHVEIDASEADLGVAVEGSIDRLNGTTVTAARVGVRVEGGVEEFRDSRIVSNESDVVVTTGGRLGVASGTEFTGAGTGLRAENGAAIDRVERNRFGGAVGVDAAHAAFISERNDFSGTDEIALRSGEGTVHSQFDYYGPRGPGDGDLAGDVDAAFFLTAPPETAADSDDELQRFGYHLQLEADEPTAIAFPAALANDLQTTFGDVEGNVYELRHGQWRPVNNPHRTPSALDAFVVTPAENATILVEFEASDDGTVTPGETSVREGWNLVGAPMATDVETAFGASSADPARALNALAAPKSPFPAADDDWVVHTFGTDATVPSVDPHAGYFVYATEDGSVAASAYEGVTFDEVRELFVDDSSTGLPPSDGQPEAATAASNASATG